MARGKAIFHQIEQDHRVPLQPLGGMDGGEHNAFLLGGVFLRAGGVQGKISDELFQIGIG